MTRFSVSGEGRPAGDEWDPRWLTFARLCFAVSALALLSMATSFWFSLDTLNRGGTWLNLSILLLGVLGLVGAGIRISAAQAHLLPAYAVGGLVLGVAEKALSSGARLSDIAAHVLVVIAFAAACRRARWPLAGVVVVLTMGGVGVLGPPEFQGGHLPPLVGLAVYALFARRSPLAAAAGAGVFGSAGAVPLTSAIIGVGFLLGEMSARRARLGVGISFVIGLLLGSWLPGAVGRVQQGYSLLALPSAFVAGLIVVGVGLELVRDRLAREPLHTDWFEGAALLVAAMLSVLGWPEIVGWIWQVPTVARVLIVGFLGTLVAAGLVSGIRAMGGAPLGATGRTLAPLLLGVLLFSRFAGFAEPLGPPWYGTDSLVMTQVGAEAVIAGENPYRATIDAAIRQFRVPLYTWKLDGSTAKGVTYPAGNFLIAVPFVRAGLRDLRWLLLLFHVGGLALLYALSPRPWGPWCALTVVTARPILDFTPGSVTDVLWLPWVLLSVATWQSVLGGVFLGIACTIKQIPWALVPFAAVRAWRTSGAKGAAVVIGAVLTTFLVVNLPFMVRDFDAWYRLALEPLISRPRNAPIGMGLSGLAASMGTLEVADRLFGMLTMGSLATAVLWYALGGYRSPGTVWPILVLLPVYWGRSLPNYFLYWTAPLALEVAREGPLPPVAKSDSTAEVRRAEG
jgi:uncharacterized membrane protein